MKTMRLRRPGRRRHRRRLRHRPRDRGEPRGGRGHRRGGRRRRRSRGPDGREIGAVAEAVDVTDAADVQALADRVLERHGRVDVVVNNAGVGPLAHVRRPAAGRLPLGSGRQLLGVLHGLKSFLPLLKANPDGGYIVNTASVAALVAAPGTSAYAASKAAVVAVSEVLAAELGDEGRSASRSCCPGWCARTSTPTPSSAPATGRAAPHGGLPARETVLEPTQVGAMVVDAIRSGRRYVFTHPETQAWVTERSEAIAAVSSSDTCRAS